jgi:hypothetical protein
MTNEFGAAAYSMLAGDVSSLNTVIDDLPPCAAAAISLT